MLEQLIQEKKVRTAELKDYRRTLYGIRATRFLLVNALSDTKQMRKQADRESNFEHVGMAHRCLNVLRKELVIVEGRYKGACAQLSFIGSQLVRLNTLIEEETARKESANAAQA